MQGRISAGMEKYCSGPAKFSLPGEEDSYHVSGLHWRITCSTMETMIKIDSNMPMQAAQSARKKKKTTTAGESGFSALLDSIGETEEVGATSETERASPVASLDAVLAMQSISEEEIVREAIKQSHETLDSLEELRLSLLVGEIPVEKLEIVRQQMQKQRQAVQDPALQQIMKEIETRAAVELAKFGLL